MNEDRKNQTVDIHDKALALYQPELRRALVIMQSTFIATVLSHTRLLGFKDRGIIKPNRVDELTAQRYADLDKANIKARSPLTEFLTTLLMRTSFDTILTEEYYEEYVLPNIESTETVQDFLLDLNARFYALWTPSENEILQISTSIVQGFKQDNQQDVVWVLPQSIVRRLPNYEYWLDKLKTNRLLLMIVILHLSAIDPSFIEDLE